ncbi:MAG: hypothetical protein ABR520_01510 [Mycobacteriales bacterium]
MTWGESLSKFRTLFVAAIVAGGSVGAISAAHASNFGGCAANTTQACFANNSTHYMYYDLTSGWRAATEATRTQSYETTNLTTILSESQYADVLYGIDTVFTAGFGYYRCLSWVNDGQGKCAKAEVNYSGPRGPELTSSQLQSVACHETGHSVGLWHPADKGLTDDPNIYQCATNRAGSFPPLLGSHNVGHINGKYLP